MGTATFIGRDATTQGAWIGVYGSDGGVVPPVVDDPGIAPPAYLTAWSITPSSTSVYQQQDNRVWALRRGPSSGIADDGFNAVWISGPDVPSSDLVLTLDRPCAISVYYWDGAVNWGDHSAPQTITILDSDGVTVLDTQALDEDFTGGVYLRWAVSGPCVVRSSTGTAFAVVSAVFFDPPASPEPVEEVGSGGVGVGGSAPASSRLVGKSSGGLAAGGSSTVAANLVGKSSGGLAAGGSAVVAVRRPSPPAVYVEPSRARIVSAGVDPYAAEVRPAKRAARRPLGLRGPGFLFRTPWGPFLKRI